MARSLVRALAFLLLVPGAGCDGVAEDGPDDEFASDGKTDGVGVEDGSPEAEGVLRVVNELSYNGLRYGVKLGPQATDGIWSFREGPDGVIESDDDRAFVTLAELDAVPYVGPVAFSKLLDYATSHGYVAVTTTALRVPLIGEEGELMTTYNDELAAAGRRERFPETVDVASGDDYSRWIRLAETLAEEIEADFYLMAYTTPDTYVYEGEGRTLALCYVGDGVEALDLSMNLNDSLFSDQFIVWGGKYKDYVYTDESFADFPEMFDDIAAWDAFDGSGEDLLVVASIDDSGEHGVGYLIPRCP